MGAMTLRRTTVSKATLRRMCDTLKNANQKNATGTVGRKPVWHIEKCHLRMSLLRLTLGR